MFSNLAHSKTLHNWRGFVIWRSRLRPGVLVMKDELSDEYRPQSVYCLILFILVNHRSAALGWLAELVQSYGDVYGLVHEFILITQLDEY